MIIKGKITFDVEVETNNNELSLYDYANEIDYDLPNTKSFRVIDSKFNTVKQTN